MAEEFDRFLAASLAPPERSTDRKFVAAVSSRIAVERRLAEERRALVGNFVEQLLALVAVALAVWWLGRSAPVSSWFAGSPAVGLAILVAGFAFLVGVVSVRPNAAT